MPPVDYWGTDFEEAVREATIRHARILALFTGSDWSPPSKRFQTEVALQTAFVNAVLGDFVLLRLDFPTHGTQPPGLHAQNARLRERFNVTTYPALLVLSAAGEQVAVVDLSKLNPALPYCEQVVGAVTEVRRLLDAPAKSPPGSTGSAEPAPAEAPPDRRVWLAVGLGACLVLVWWLLRRGRDGGVQIPATPAAAASEVPTLADATGWSQTRLRNVCIAVFEAGGYRVKLRPPESGAELALHRNDTDKAEILVHCRPGTTGLAGPRTVRELLGTVVAEGVPTGWVVAPGGFTAEARKVAAERGLLLIGGEDLLQRLAEVPPLALLRVLSRSV